MKDLLKCCLLMMNFTMSDNITVIVIINFIDVVMTFVLIPGAYILNTEVMKRRVIENGWFRSLRSVSTSGRIEPATNEAANNN